MKLVKILIGLVVLLIVALFVTGLFADGIAKKAIEAGGSYALGTDTKVESVDIGFLSGTFSMDGLAVANPEGHGDGSFLQLGNGNVEVSATSLLSDKIEVPEIAFSGIRVNLVQGLKGSNYGKILDNLKRIQGSESGAPAAGGGESSGGEEGEGKRFLIHKLTMTDLEVSVVPVPEMNLAAVKVPIDKIELTNIGTESDKGVLLSDLAGIVVEAILKRASASGQLPGLIQGALNGQLGQLKGLSDAGIQALDGILPGGPTGGVEAAKDAINEKLKGFGIGR